MQKKIRIRKLGQAMLAVLWSVLLLTLSLVPAEGKIIGSVETPSSAEGVAVSENMAYVACCGGSDTEWSGLQLIDVRNPENPVCIGSIATSGCINGIAAEGDMVYVADVTGGDMIFGMVGKFEVIDVSDPENPKIVGSVDTNATGVAVSGGTAYVTGLSTGLQVIDVSDPKHPFVIGEVESPDTTDWFPDISDISIGGLPMMDGSDPELPFVIGETDSLDTSGLFPNITTGSDVAISGETAYVADLYEGLQIIDVSDPEAPSVIHTVDTGIAVGVVVSGDMVYVARGSSGLQLIDVSQPESPAVISTVDTPAYSRGVVARDAIVYVVDGASHLKVINVSDPETPVIVGSVDTPGSARSLAVRGDTAYVADGDGGLQVIAVTIPVNNDFADAAELAGLSGQAVGSNALATKESEEPDHAGGSGGKSLWWTWTAPETGWFCFDTRGSDVDTLLAVYTGSALKTLTTVAGNDDDGSDNGNSGLFFQAQSGVRYHVATDGKNGQCGDILLSWGKLSLMTGPFTMEMSGEAYAEGKKITSDGYVIAAFGPGGYADCRGISDITESDGKWEYHLTVASDTDGEIITFGIWDGSNSRTHSVKDTVVFEAGADIRKSLGMPLKIADVQPEYGAAGQDLEITLTGTGFDEYTEIALYSEAGGQVRPEAITLVSQTQLSLVIPATAATGKYTLKVSNETESHELPDALTFGAPDWTPVSGRLGMEISGGVWLYGNRIETTGYTIAAFGPGGAGDCRGKAEILHSAGEWTYSLTIVSDTEGEDISFRIWDSNSGRLLTPDDSIAFGAGEVVVKHISRPLNLESAYPALAEAGKNHEVVVTGSGFDEHTRISMYRDIGSRKRIIGSWQCVNCFAEPLDVAVVGDIAYVADGSGGLKLADVSQPETPVIIASVDTPSSANSVAVAGDTAYVADSNGSLLVIDVSQPKNPAIIGSVLLPGPAQGVAVAEGVAYVADSYCGLQIIRVSQPETPVIIASVDTEYLAWDVIVMKNTAYVSDGSMTDAESSLKVIDISQPERPVIIASVDMAGSLGSNSVAAAGDTVYVADGTSGLKIIDVSQPERPVLRASAGILGMTQSVAVTEDTAYVSVFPGDGLQVIDVSQPEHPVLTGFADTASMGFSLAVTGDTVYMAGYSDGLRVIRVSNPATPAIIGSAGTPSSADPPVSVNDVAVAGNTAYVADTWKGLELLNVARPERPVLISAVHTPGSALAVTVTDDTAYVADGTGGLQIIDVSQPETPVIASSVDIPNGSAHDVAITGDMAYVAGGESGLQLVDVSDPERPVLIASGHFGDALSVTVTSDTAYVGDGDGGLHVIDVSQPERPVLRAKLPALGAAILGVTVKGDTVYAADGDGGLHIIDVSRKEAPEVISDLDSPAISDPFSLPDMPECPGIVVREDTVYVTNRSSGLQIIDVSHPETPVLTGSVDTPGSAVSVTVKGDIAYVADRNGGLQLADVRQPETPVMMASADTQGEAVSIAVKGDTLYVADGDGGLQVTDVSVPEAPVLTGSADLPGSASDVAVTGSTAYVACRKGSDNGWTGLQVIDVSEPENPVLIGSVVTPGEASGIAVMGDTAYVADGPSGLQVADVSQPQTPVIIGAVDTPTSAESVVVVGDTAYVADGSSGLQIIDVSQPQTPVIIGSADTPGWAGDVAVAGDMAYIADWVGASVLSDQGSTRPLGGLRMIDVSQPENPVIIGSVDTPSPANSVMVMGNTAYVACGDERINGMQGVLGNPMAKGWSGLQIIDVSRPENPAVIGSVDTSDCANGVSVMGDTAYVADGEGGLAVILSVPSVIIPESFQVESDTLISLTLSAPEIDQDHYILRVHNENESHELLGAVSFVTPENAYLLDTKAIIVAGGGDGPENKIWSETRTAAEYAYDTLLYQGYTHESIYYLSSETDPDSDRIDDFATPDNLSYAIREWAGADPPATELLLYLADHGTNEKFIINAEDDLSAEALDNWLDELQTSAEPVPVTVIYDACRSGSFLPALTPPDGAERIVMSSALSDESAYYLSSGTLSFSWQFWDAISKGESVGDAFSHAAEQMASEQTALLDSDGNGIGNEPEDFSIASDMQLRRAYRPVTDVPFIYEVAEPQIIYAPATSAKLFAGISYVEDSSETRRVWAVIEPPDFTPGSPDNPVSELPEVDLTDPDGDGVYEVVYDGFVAKGEYRIKICAMSKKGVYSLFRDTVVTKSAKYVHSAEPDQKMVYGEHPSATLRAVVNTGDSELPVARVWAEITSPSPGSVAFQDDDGDGTWEAVFTGFTSQETHEFHVFAEDAEGFVCPYAVTTVTWAGEAPDADDHENDNTSGQAGHITLNDTVLQHRSFHRADDADWVKFLALPGKTYNIRILGTGAACAPAAELLKDDGVTPESGIVQETGPDGAQHIGFTCKAPGIRFVRLRNGDPGVFGKDVTYDLEIYRPAASDTGTVQGVITDISGNPIPDARLMTTDGGSDLSRNDGTYTLITPAGEQTLTADADGYERVRVSVTMTVDGTLTQDIVMMPDSSRSGDLENALMILHLLTGQAEPLRMPDLTDVSGDGRIGLPEVIRLLQDAAGM